LTDQTRPVFVTGATGFIGGRLAEALHARGRRLRCLVRDSSRAEALVRLGADLVFGDVADAAAVARGLQGAELAFHLAACYRVGVVDARALEHTNVEGTRTFLEAAREVGVPRIVHVSTSAALGPAGTALRGVRSRWSGPFPTVYHRTKTRAHELALAAQDAGAPVIIVCPAFVYGPGDRGPAGQFLEDLLGGRIPALTTDPAWFSFVHVDDVVAGLLAAGERGLAGATYVLGGEEATLNVFAVQAAVQAGRRPPRIRLARGLALLLAGACDLAGRVTGARLPLSREGVRSTTRERCQKDRSGSWATCPVHSPPGCPQLSERS